MKKKVKVLLNVWIAGSIVIIMLQIMNYKRQRATYSALVTLTSSTPEQQALAREGLDPWYQSIVTETLGCIMLLYFILRFSLQTVAIDKEEKSNK